MSAAGEASSNSAAAPSRAATSVAFVTSITENDILLGRGAPIINNPGNVRFRELVRSRKEEYSQMVHYTGKDKIARELMQEIANRNGRFLRKIDSVEEARVLGVPAGVRQAWRLADDTVALEKVKQTLRDREYVRPVARARGTGGAAVQNKVSRTSSASRRGSSSSKHSSTSGNLPAAATSRRESQEGGVASSSKKTPLTQQQHGPQAPSFLGDLQQQQRGVDQQQQGVVPPPAPPIRDENDLIRQLLQHEQDRVAQEILFLQQRMQLHHQQQQAQQQLRGLSAPAAAPPAFLEPQLWERRHPPAAARQDLDPNASNSATVPQLSQQGGAGWAVPSVEQRLLLAAIRQSQATSSNNPRMAGAASASRPLNPAAAPAPAAPLSSPVAAGGGFAAPRPAPAAGLYAGESAAAAPVAEQLPALDPALLLLLLQQQQQQQQQQSGGAVGIPLQLPPPLPTASTPRGNSAGAPGVSRTINPQQQQQQQNSATSNSAERCRPSKRKADGTGSSPGSTSGPPSPPQETKPPARKK